MADLQAYVVDDPNTLFKVAVVSGTTTIGSVTRAAVGNNAQLVQNSGVAATGNSRVAINATVATTNTFPVRVIDVIPETQSSAGNFTEVVVKWNEPTTGAVGGHQYRQATGI